MHEKIVLALQTAEENYAYFKHLKTREGSSSSPDHIMALNALFDVFIYYGFAVSQTSEVIQEIDEESGLFESLIEPHLRVVDDIEMIARQYTKMYVQYIAKIAQGFDSKSAVENLFV